MAVKRIHSRSPFYISSTDAPYVLNPPIEINCGDVHDTAFDVGYKTYTLNVGTDTGDISIVYSGNNVPVKFNLEWNDGAESATTNYVGLDAYDDQLIAAGVAPELIATGDPSTKNGTLTIAKTATEPTTATLTVEAPLLNDDYSFELVCPSVIPPAPTCPDRALVFQICNSNFAKDDNFDVYLNDNYIGYLDLSENAQVGSIFIATESETLSVTEGDFACPLTLMETYRFDPDFVYFGENKLELRNAQENFNGNYGTIGIRNYLIDGDSLSEPCVVANLEYSGITGSSFTLYFDYTACCPLDLPELIS
jgi:hypothetical protein